jgi:O-antigen/teichoic acid export membrane protein
VSGFAIAAMQIRYLGLDQYGAFVISFGIAILLTVPTRLGIDSGVNHFLVRARLDRSMPAIRFFFWGSIVVPLTLGLLLSLFTHEWATLINDRFYESVNFYVAMHILGYGMPLLAIAELPGIMTRAFETNRYFVLSNNIFGQCAEALMLLTLIGGAPYGMIGDRLAAVVAVRLIGKAIVFSVGSYGFFELYRGMAENTGAVLIGPIRAKTVCSHLKALLHYSTPLLFSNVFLRVTQWTDTIVLGAFLTDSAAGAYRIAVQLSMALTGVLYSVGSILGPIIAKYYHRKEINKIVPIYLQSVRLSTLGVLPFVISMVFFPEYFLRLFDNNAVRASSALVLLALAQLFNTFTGNVGTILTMAGKPHWHAVNGIVVTISQIGLCLVVVPKMGVTGAATVSLLTIVMLNTLRFWETKKFFGLYCISRQTLEPVIPASIAVVFMVLLKYSTPEEFTINPMLVVIFTTLTNCCLIWGLHKLLFMRQEDKMFFSFLPFEKKHG